MRRDAVALTKPVVFLAALAPFLALAWDVWHAALGPDPVAQIEHRTGDWALRFLLVTLAVTPLRRLTGWNRLARYRRMFGLFAFFYATAHLATYLVIDLGGFWRQLFVEIVKRPYITVGFLAWLLLVPLAVTSTQGMMRRLGRRWQLLHRLVYACAILGILHFLWLVKSGEKIAVREPLVYLGVFAVLMLARLPWQRWMAAWRGKPAAPSASVRSRT